MRLPHDGHVRCFFFSSRALFDSPAYVISQPTPSVAMASVITCGSRVISLPLGRLLSSVGVRSEVQLATPPIGYVRIELGGGQIRVSKHFLNRPEVRAALEEVGGEGMAEQVRVHAFRLEPGLLGELAQDEESPGPGQRAALRFEEELGAVARVEVGAAAAEIAVERLDGRAADRDDP